MTEAELERLFVAYQSDYINFYPYVSLKEREPPDGNGILYAGVYGMLIQALFGKYNGASAHAWALYCDALPIDQESGVITRGKFKREDPQGHDDYIGICALSFLGNKSVAHLIAYHGENNFWRYRTGKTSFWSSLFFIKPGVVQHIKLCAGRKWNWWDRFWFKMALVDSLKKNKDSTSGRIMEWLMVRCYLQSDHRNQYCDNIVTKWQESIRQTYPGLMGDVFEIYYGKDHLFAKFGKGVL